ncbi:hypothetical protein IEQ34_027036 [Dendrobium chrysotoxum]|uniref:40S ribosomal protein S17 n=1 Tax=Dendrobium chrysotoxum TaxID=161865 RepID=A0AAV7FH82_DENCH|nr:hypothetical protein IEQ34_027036 [Dendrobium chrysotoxum]
MADHLVREPGATRDLKRKGYEEKRNPKHNSEAAAARAMGRVRTKTVKKSSRQVIEKYYSRMTLDFHTNKKVLEEVAIIPSKRLRNKIAGFSTHLMRRIQRGPVRGISLKLQEEERERRMDFVPEESEIKVERIEVDSDTLDMLTSIGMAELPGVEKMTEAPAAPAFVGRPAFAAEGKAAPEFRVVEIREQRYIQNNFLICQTAIIIFI